MKTNLFLALAPVTLLCAPLLAASPAPQSSGKLVIEAGRIVTPSGDIEDGLIVIEDGRIIAIGSADEVEKPWDAPLLGGPEFVAFPGFVEAHTSRGMDRANESTDVAPFLDIRDAIDPVAYYFEDCLRYGITTVNVQQGANCVIGGRGMIVRPHGMTVDSITVRPLFGMKLSARPKKGKSRATQMQALRLAFDDLRRYLEDLVEKERDERGHAQREALYQGRELDEEDDDGRAMGGSSWKVEGLELIPRGALDEKYEPLLDLMEGRYPIFFHCGSSLDVRHALDLARDNGLLARTTLVLDDDCWKAADLIAEAGVPVILEGDLVDVRRDAITGEEKETFVPGVLQEKGIRFALSSEVPSLRSPAYQAAIAIGYGLDPQVAIDAVTRTAAEILGLGNEIGSLEKGKLANVLLFSGDPLSVTSWVEHVILEGEHVYERSQDIRNKHLLEGVQPAGTAPPSAKGEDGESEEEHGDEHDGAEHDGDEHGDGDHGDGDEHDDDDEHKDDSDDDDDKGEDEGEDDKR